MAREMWNECLRCMRWHRDPNTIIMVEEVPTSNVIVAIDTPAPSHQTCKHEKERPLRWGRQQKRTEKKKKHAELWKPDNGFGHRTFLQIFLMLVLLLPSPSPMFVCLRLFSSLSHFHIQFAAASSQHHPKILLSPVIQWMLVIFLTNINYNTLLPLLNKWF